MCAISGRDYGAPSIAGPWALAPCAQWKMMAENTCYYDVSPVGIPTTSGARAVACCHQDIIEHPCQRFYKIHQEER